MFGRSGIDSSEGTPNVFYQSAAFITLLHNSIDLSGLVNILTGQPTVVVASTTFTVAIMPIADPVSSKL